MARLLTWHNGEKSWRPFSDAEMDRRQGLLRRYSADNRINDEDRLAFAFNAFLAGYSLDSVVELFGSSMDQRSAAQHANLKQQMGVR